MEEEIIKTEKLPEEKKKGSWWKLFLDFAIYLFIVVAVVFGLPKLLTQVLHTQYPMAAITSGSMWPVLKEGDLVFIQGVNSTDLKINDIVVYKNRVNNTLTIHRIVKLDKDTLTTKGDANFSEDSPAKYEDVIGRAVFIGNSPARIPYLGSVTILAGKYLKANGNQNGN